jgi:hypothetical protein
MQVADNISIIKEKKMKIYIAGPMRGYPQFNFPAFYDAQEWLTAKGYETFNPAQSDKEHYGENVNNSATGDLSDPAAQTGFSLREALGRDAAWITAHADALYMLTGWEKSTGAKAEWTLAVALGLQIFYQGGIEEYEYKAADWDYNG